MTGFPGATYKKFASPAEAQDWIASHGNGKAPASTGPSAPWPTPAATALRVSAPPSARPITNLPTAPSRAPAGPRTPEPPAPGPAGAAPKRQKRDLARQQPVEDESAWQIVYSDGACKGNGRVGSVAGVGVWWGDVDERWVSGHALIDFCI